MDLLTCADRLLATTASCRGVRPGGTCRSFRPWTTPSGFLSCSRASSSLASSLECTAWNSTCTGRAPLPLPLCALPRLCLGVGAGLYVSLALSSVPLCVRMMGPSLSHQSAPCPGPPYTQGRGEP